MKDVLVHHRFCLFFAVLAGVEAVVGAVGGHEGAMGAALDDLAVMHDHDHVRAADGRQAVGDDEGGAAGHDLLDGVLDELLGHGVDGARRLVQHEDARVGQQRAGKGQQLLFAGGEGVAALADVGIIAVRQSCDDLVGRDGLDCGLDLIHCRVGTAVAQVFQDRAGEQVRRLQHVADVGVQPELAARTRVAAVDEHATLRRLKEAADEVHERGFARAGLADDGDVRALRDLEAEVLQHVLAAVGVAEGDVLELDIAVERLPVFLLRVEGVAVFLRDFRRVAHVGLGLHELGEALDVDLHVDERRDDLHEPLHRLHHALRVVHEHGERTDEHHAVFRDDAAAPEDDRQRDGGGEGRRRHEDTAEVHGAHAHALHLAGEAVKLALDLILDHERFGGLRAGDALVERAGDARVLLAHPAVEKDELLLEIRARDDEDRHDHHHAQRQMPVEHEHHDDGEQQIRDVPHALHESPGQRACDAVGIRHDAGVDVTDAVLVEIGERERLQVVEGLALEIPADVELDLARAVGRDVVRGRLDEHDQNVEGQEAADAVHGLLGDKMVDGVLLEQGDDRVHGAADPAHGHHPEKQHPVGLQIRGQLRDAEERQALLFFSLHAGSSSPMDICMS